MDSFLAQLAEALYDKYGDGVSELEVIFPSRRAHLFFGDELARIAGHPLWSPRAVSIDDVVEELSGMRSGDRVRLITELYKVYSRHHEESFDSFFFWGEMLLADFDSIDKYLIQPDILFANVADLKLLEADTSYLTEEQTRIIARFWGSFGHGEYSEQQEKFLKIWTTLAPIYHEFRAELEAKGLVYSGLAYRMAAEAVKRGEAHIGARRKFVIAGFNALSECEKVIFDYLQKNHDVEFFWDWDHYYVDKPEQEAGLFLRENLRRYPPQTPLKEDFRGFAGAKNIAVVSAPSDSLQCKYVADFLRSIDNPGRETAIVLTDENLLTPVLHAIPEGVVAVNVTMGYPLKSTLEYSFAERLITLQMRWKADGKGFHRDDIKGLANHPLLNGQDIFRPVNDGWQELADYLKEILINSSGSHDFVDIIVENIDKLRNSLSGCDVELTAQTFVSLLRRVLQSVRVPFEGEPLDGVQIMGILETRNLDFENVLILSLTDDTFPGVRAAAASFIPHNLRLAYGLPTPQHHEGVFAYYFYRLLQRASVVNLAYSARADERSSGEQSRYIYQLEYESPHKIERRELAVEVSVEPREAISVAKTALPTRLSPTSFFNFVQCPLKFYFHSVARLKAPREMGEGVDAPLFGELLHKAMELLYRDKTTLEAAVEGAVGALNDFERANEGAVILAREIVKKYIGGSIVPFDRRNNAVVEMLETPLSATIAGIEFFGIADRVDRLSDGSARIVDYKTGALNIEFKGVEALFSSDPKDQNAAALQTFLYAMMFAHSMGNDVQPALYFVRAMRAPEYSPLLFDRETGAFVEFYSDYRAEFEELLAAKIAELRDISVPFTQCEGNAACEFCDFNVICKR